ncbi:hypothetical protein ACFWIQ_31675 [Kitasatospora sp. NPDC127059]|uniref:hypothetical protein n=1 Tax=unclassified Kitasatospora TaxID=2633591 RepID=UPI003649F168
MVSPESERRDHGVKLGKYARAGIPHRWTVEDESGQPVVPVFVLRRAVSAYAPAGIFRGTLERPVPFPVAIDLRCAAD